MTNDFARQSESVAKVLFLQVESCRCDVVRKYLESPRSPIEDVLLVGEELTLEWVASLFCEWANESAESIRWKQTQITLLYEAGHLLGLNWPQTSEIVLRWQDIPGDWPCRVLYLPPYYVIQLENNSESRVA